MSFPLAEWIDGHEECRHNLGKSGMLGAIPPPVPSRAEVRRADPEELRARLAEELAVEPSEVLLTTGASQANALAILFLARESHRIGPGDCRVCYPEYPPLFDLARSAGYRLVEAPGRADLAVVSQPRNPEGDLWDRSRFLEWTSGARSVVADETFREFAGTRSLLGMGRPALWVTGSFTKFYAADDLRVGFVVPPPERRRDFARFYGLARNKLPSYSVAGASRALREREATRRRVRSILRANLSALARAFPGSRLPDAPVFFDRPETGEDGDSLAWRALDASVLVCSGSFFGDPAGVRLCLTQRSFPADLAAYLSVRNHPRDGRARRGERSTPSVRHAPRRPGGTARARVAPS